MTRTALAVLLAVVTALSPAAARGPSPGDRGEVRTVLQGNVVETIPVRYLGVLRSAIGAGVDLHLVELEGPTADEVGVAAGMSGSPVYFGGRLFGALGYRLGTLPTKPIGGVVRFEDMEAARLAASGGREVGAGAAPIATPVTLSGVAPEVRSWLAGELVTSGMVLAPGGAEAQEATPALDGDEPTAPGQPLAVELVRGDLRIAATGTVTAVENGVVYAFGHPFIGSGRAELPMARAEIVHTLADRVGSLKLANIGPEIGAILDDRLTAVVGRIGGTARMIPVEVRIAENDGVRTRRFEVARQSELTPTLVASAVANVLISDVRFERRATVLAKGRIRFEHEAPLPLELAFSSATGAEPAIAAAVALQGVIAAVYRNPFREPDVAGIDLDLEAGGDASAFALSDLLYDRGTVRPGSTIAVTAVLDRYRGEPLRRRIDLPVPVGLAPGTRIALVVGDPDSVDRLTAGPEDVRLASAADLPSYLAVLAGRRPANVLTAVLVRADDGLVAAGAVRHDLPPSAERLAADGPNARPSLRERRRLAPLTRIEDALPGPVQGVATAVFTIAGGSEP